MNHLTSQVKSVTTMTALLIDELNAIQTREDALETEYKNIQIEYVKLDRAKQAVKAEHDRLQIQRFEILHRLQEFSNEISSKSA